MLPEFYLPFVSMAAARLAGRPVDVQLRRPPPPYDTADGLAFKSGTRGVVVVDPDLPDDRLLYVLCHEAAHLRLHWHTLGDIGDTSGPLPAPRYTWSPAIEAEETQADRLARAWVKLAQGWSDQLLGQMLGLAITTAEVIKECQTKSRI